MINFNQEAIKHAYQNCTKVYEWLTPIYILPE